MNAKIKSKWVKALRSGKFKQGKGTLRHSGRHCCLGVLCVVLNAPIRSNQGNLPEYVAIEADISIQDEDLLQEANDRRGWTFDEIADYVEIML